MADRIEKKYGYVFHPTTLRKYVDGSPRDPDWRTVTCVMGIMLDLPKDPGDEFTGW